MEECLTAAEQLNPASFATHRFSDADDLAAALLDAGIEYVPLTAGPYPSVHTTYQLGSMTLQHVLDQPHVAQGRIAPGRAVMLMPLRQLDRPVINGVAVDDSDAVLLRPGQEVHSLCPAAEEWASLSIPADDAVLLLDLARVPSRLWRQGPMLRVPPGGVAPLQQLIGGITDHVRHSPASAAVHGFAPAVQGALAEAMIEAFAQADGWLPVARARRSAMRLVRQAEELLGANPFQPLFTAELCSELGVSPNTLHAAFVAVCAMSPQAYLKRRRLMMAHRALKSGEPGAVLVKSVALAHGFLHFGNFAHDYRAQFGQSPSRTLALARSGAFRRRNVAAAAVADHALA